MIGVKKPIHGVGINDADYVVTPLINGKQVYCPFYLAWKGMISRCYDPSVRKRQPSYDGCTVCDEWKIFSNFKNWMEKQDWKGREVDKDILVKGNKVYSPETCLMVRTITNTYVQDALSLSENSAMGVQVTFTKAGVPRYRAIAKNPLRNNSESLGTYDTEKECHQAWRRRKHEFACIIAASESDARVIAFLMTAFLPS